MSKVTRVVQWIAVLAACSGILFLALRSRGEAPGGTDSLDARAVSILEEYGITEQYCTRVAREWKYAGRIPVRVIERDYMVPGDFSGEGFLASLREAAHSFSFRIQRVRQEKTADRIVHEYGIGRKDTRTYCLRLTVDAAGTSQAVAQPGDAEGECRGTIAIVLDDFGYSVSNFESLIDIGIPVTISLLPNLPYTAHIAEEAPAHGIEVLIHLPMEPHNNHVRLEENTLTTAMSQEEIRTLFRDALRSIPCATGVSNHMGSRATEDNDLMKTIFEECLTHNLYFLDNLVTDHSVCTEVAGTLGARVITRDVFLDNRDDAEYIRGQLEYAAGIAEKRGIAISVGHDRPSTVATLARMLPALKEKGYSFVTLSEVVNNNEYSGY